MVKLNTKALKPDMQIQKNVLYQINENRIVPVREEHKDCADTETVNLRYVLGDRQYAVYASLCLWQFLSAASVFTEMDKRFRICCFCRNWLRCLTSSVKKDILKLIAL